ncbi:RNA 2',3'-cyclic phosphodiesterase [Ramlibacter sp. G-1-2-2]|uniref:RNA 2',3'-cyclic phosphodiesterase n=1 Tax=Ramlibacter agri TaxID=2728837 RepID=A0A848HCY9_9BURK|nr:RNA 2',3'-cyclic phosphodiesterase [Ramlibacter agri]NML45398.1 RNA 2',3'-cyclic phosphodiesterase [Ramlibacter agri]
MDESWRLFLGLWPSAEVRGAIVRQADTWRWPAGARRTQPERLHVTLHFLGNVAVERIQPLREALPARWDGCLLELDQAEVSPGGIVVLEAGTVPAPLAALHADLAAVLERLGLPVETRPYRPHVTLARKGQGAQPPAFEPVAWQLAPDYVLARSLPGGGGYVPVQAFG